MVGDQTNPRPPCPNRKVNVVAMAAACGVATKGACASAQRSRRAKIEKCCCRDGLLTFLDGRSALFEVLTFARQLAVAVAPYKVEDMGLSRTRHRPEAGRLAR